MKDKDRTRRFNQVRQQQLKRRTAIQKDARAEVLRLLDLAQQRIALLLASAPSDYQQWILPQMQQSVRQAMQELGDDAGAVMSQKAGLAWQAGLDLVDEPLRATGIQVAGIVPEVDTRQLLSMRAFMTDRMKDVSVQLANKVNTEMGLAAIGAQTTSDTITNVAGLIKSGGRSRAITIVRTELGRAYSVATQARGSAAAKVVPGLKKLWRRSGKIHSRLQHDATDGQVQDWDAPFNIGGVLMMHPHDPAAPAKETINCGCQSLPWKEDWPVDHPGKKPFTEEELIRNPFKRELQNERVAAVVSRGSGELKRRAYGDALVGGKNAGLLRRHRADSAVQLKKSVRSLEKQIQKHQTWITDPTEKTVDFTALHPNQQRHLVEEKWPADIRRHREQIDILQGIIEERGDGDA